ncbi:50S ribosomal protein L1 [bacterium]|nr:50S ribosomal protein L1 [bacterium]
MGQKKIKTVGEEAKKEEKKVRVAGLKGGERVKVVEAEAVDIEKVKKEIRSKKKIRQRSKRYLEAKAKVDRTKLYPLKEAVALVKKTSLSKFVGNLEAHLVVDSTGEIGEVQLPHFKGKEKKVVVADDKVIARIKEGKIDFDVLLASPKMMPKIVPLARVLGPKGLMPNPKNGTLVDNPQEAVKKFSQGGVIKIKTEKKAPVVHLVLGKLDQPDKELVANVEALIAAIGKQRIKKMTLCATMGPGVKVAVN